MRPKRIRCRCCQRLMSMLPYNPGDAIRRSAPQAGHCVDCDPDDATYHMNRWAQHNQASRCENRYCEPQNVLERLALILHREAEAGV